MTLPSVPVFLSVTGLYDVEYQISVACRDACVYTIKRYLYTQLLLASFPGLPSCRFSCY